MSIKSIFRKGRVGYIGLDVSTGYIAAVQLEGVAGGKNFHVVGWSRLKIPVGVVHEGRIVNPEKFKRLVKEMFSKPSVGELDGRHVILSLAEHQCYHRSFSSKKIGKTQTLFALAYNEISQSVPYDIVEMEWDWVLVLDELRYYRVYSVAILKSVVEEYRAALKGVGMIMPVIEPQVISASRLMFEQQSVAEPIIYLEIGLEESAVATIDQMGVHQSSVVANGTASWIAGLAQKLKVEKSTAKKVLESIGLRKVKHEKAAMIRQSVREYLEPIKREIKQHMTYYQYLHGKESVPLQSLMINGKGALIPGLGEDLASSLEMDLRQMQSWAKFDPPFSPKQVLLLHNAIGAAMRGVFGAESRSEGVNVLYTRKHIEQKKESWYRNIIKKKKPGLKKLKS